MSNYQERPTHFPWPVITFVCAACLALILDMILPAYWLQGPIAEFLFALGWLILFAALALIFSSIRTLHNHKTTVSPIKAANSLVTTGPYTFSRNPIYLGLAAAMVGLAFIMASIWFIVFMFPAAFVVQKRAIEPEEKHLQQRFGRKWREYSRKVRRWF